MGGIRRCGTRTTRASMPAATLTIDEVERTLLPALRDAGVTTEHLVSFRPDAAPDSGGPPGGRGHSLTWDLVMDLEGSRAVGGPAAARDVEELGAGAELWDRVLDSLALFEAGTDETIAQLRAIEQEVLSPGGAKRWFGIRDDRGVLVSLGAVLVLEGVGYLDNVATFPEARGRGLAAGSQGRSCGLPWPTAPATSVCWPTRMPHGSCACTSGSDSAEPGCSLLREGPSRRPGAPPDVDASDGRRHVARLGEQSPVSLQHPGRALLAQRRVLD